MTTSSTALRTDSIPSGANTSQSAGEGFDPLDEKYIQEFHNCAKNHSGRTLDQISKGLGLLAQLEGDPNYKPSLDKFIDAEILPKDIEKGCFKKYFDTEAAREWLAKPANLRAALLWIPPSEMYHIPDILHAVLYLRDTAAAISILKKRKGIEFNTEAGQYGFHKNKLTALQAAYEAYRSCDAEASDAFSKVIKLLIKRGVDVNALDNNGDTLLDRILADNDGNMLASCHRQKIDLKDKHGKGLLELASEFNRASEDVTQTSKSWSQEDHLVINEIVDSDTKTSDSEIQELPASPQDEQHLMQRIQRIYNSLIEFIQTTFNGASNLLRQIGKLLISIFQTPVVKPYESAYSSMPD